MKQAIRKISSLSLLVSFILLSYTGLILFIAPPGRIAYWANWEILGMTRTQYVNVHNMMSFLFIFMGILHLWLNWGPIVNYMKTRSKKLIVVTREVSIALVISALVLFGTLSEVPPFTTMMDFGADVSASWEDTYGTPPFNHAELYPLVIFAKKMNLDLEMSENLMREAGITDFNKTNTLATIAKKNGISPQDIWNVIEVAEIDEDVAVESVSASAKAPEKTESAPVAENDHPAGLGRMTLEDAAKKYGLGLAESIEKLQAEGFAPEADMTVKAISAQKDVLPADVWQIIK